MKEENKAFLEANAHHGVNAHNDFFKNLGGETRQRFQQIMSEEFRPGYTTDLWCDKCALEMIKTLFIHYQQWKDANPEPVPEPIIEESLIVAANFPSHKKKKQ